MPRVAQSDRAIYGNYRDVQCDCCNRCRYPCLNFAIKLHVPYTSVRQRTPRHSASPKAAATAGFSCALLLICYNSSVKIGGISNSDLNAALDNAVHQMSDAIILAKAAKHSVNLDLIESTEHLCRIASDNLDEIEKEIIKRGIAGANEHDARPSHLSLN